MGRRSKYVLTFFITAFVIYFAVEEFVFPLLLPHFRTWIVSFLSSLSGAVAFLAALAQISGVSLRRLFRKGNNETSQANQGVILVASDKSTINISGSTLRGLKQEKDSEFSVVGSSPFSTDKDIRGLITKIQDNLYSDPRQLPYLITLCVDLTQRVGLASKYHKWLKKELVGYEINDMPDDEIDLDDEQWLKQWASHRLVQMYVKFGFTSAETGKYRIENFPFRRLIYGQSISEVVSEMEKAEITGSDEYGGSLKELGQGLWGELEAFLSELNYEVSLPHDTRIFFKVSAFNNIVNGVRAKILDLLTDVRKI